MTTYINHWRLTSWISQLLNALIIFHLSLVLRYTDLEYVSKRTGTVFNINSRWIALKRSRMTIRPTDDRQIPVLRISLEFSRDAVTQDGRKFRLPRSACHPYSLEQYSLAICFSKTFWSAHKGIIKYDLQCEYCNKNGCRLAATATQQNN